MKDLYTLVVSFLAIIGLYFPAAAQAPVHKQTQSSILLTGPKVVSVTFPSSSNAGNLIIAHITWDRQNRTLQSVVDTKGNTYHLIGAPTNWGTKYKSALYYAYNIAADATKIKVTATLDNNTTALFEIYISEYSNVLTTSDPLDKNRTNNGTGTAINSGSVTTVAANELIWGVSIGEDKVINGGTGFNVRSTDQDNIVEDRSGSAAGAYSAGFTAVGSTNWVAQIATFKPLVILPITLLSFDASSLSNRRVELDWATSAESNSDHFEVQRSRDGLDWIGIGQVVAAGNSGATQQYSFVDDTPYTGVTWYRLKQVDRDANAYFSKTLTVHIDQPVAAGLHIYPNPAASYLVVEGASQAISIFSTAGLRMMVRMVPEGETKTTLDLTSLPRGAYFVKAGERNTVFLKQ